MTHKQGIDLFLDLNQLVDVFELVLLNNLGKKFVGSLLSELAVDEGVHAFHESDHVLLGELDFLHHGFHDFELSHGLRLAYKAHATCIGGEPHHQVGEPGEELVGQFHGLGNRSEILQRDEYVLPVGIAESRQLI